MRICLVSREVPPFVGGGISTYIAELSRALVAAGHQVHVLTSPFPGLGERGGSALPGATLHAVDLDTGPASIPGAHFSEASRYSMAVYTALRELSARHRFDYVEFPEYLGEGYFSLRAKRALGEFAETVLGVRLHTPLYVAREFDRTAVVNLEVAHAGHMERGSVAEADLVLSASRAMLERALADLPQPAPSPADLPREVLPLPLDVDAVQAQCPETGIDPVTEPGRKTILYFGRLQLIKGVVELVRAGGWVLERGHEVRFVFIGGDTETGPFGRSMREHLLRLAASGPGADRFEFPGPRPRAELLAEIRHAAVCCFPSRWESFSMACVEAMAAGAVVVTSDAGGLGEIVSHGVSGLTFKAGDNDSLGVMLEKALCDAPLRQTCRALAPIRARQLCGAGPIAARLVELVERHRPAILERARQAARRARPRPASPDRPELSVIVPFYNLGRYLPETLASLSRQTYRDFELLIVDDGSTEPDSLALLDDLRSRGYRVIAKRNGGLGSARNAGFEAARGDFVLPIDADDIAHPTWAQTLLSAIRRQPGLASVSPMFTSFCDEPEEARSGYVPLAIDPDLLLLHNIAGPGGGSIVAREAWKQAGGYDEWLTSFEDWDFWCRLAERGRRGVAIPEFLLYYRLRPGSLIRAEATPRHHALRAYLIAQHPTLPSRPDLALRAQLAEAEAAKALAAHWEQEHAHLGARLNGFAAGDPEAHLAQAARRLIDENLRYRLADKLNRVLKRSGLQGPAKSAVLSARRLIRRR
ncbi:MAG TPA: glycosyltransferase [Phycisphaerales bacterium]|nr:glycosyltransferase [Phycisphaerales bacterium]